MLQKATHLSWNTSKAGQEQHHTEDAPVEAYLGSEC